MVKATSEVVIVFWQDGQPIGLLYQNGKREFYKVSHASKENVAIMLDVDAKVETK